MSDKSNELQIKSLAVELMSYGEFVVGKEQINPNNMRDGFKDIVKFQSWGTKDKKQNTEKDVLRAQEILKTFGINFKKQDDTFTGRHNFSTGKSVDDPLIKWFMDVQKIIKDKSEQSNSINLLNNTGRDSNY